jgi:hypothetical protein
MANTYTIIDKAILGSDQASVSFTGLSAYSSDYTDLKVVLSARTDRAFSVDALGYYYNSDTTSARYTGKQLTGTGATTQSTSYNPSNDEGIYVSGNTATASTFGNGEIYIPNAYGSKQKSSSVDGVSENNGTTAYASMGASLYNQTTAISSIHFVPITGTVIKSGSSFYLYGIKNS